MFLDKGNKLHSIPAACAIHKKELYENEKEILSCVSYKGYRWHISSDLNVTAIQYNQQVKRHFV